MNHFRQRVAALALVGSVLGGAVVAGVPGLAGAATSSTAAPTPAFSGPEPLPQYLQLLVQVGIGFAEEAPSLVLVDGEVYLQKVLAETESRLKGL
jgi:hypothetical protein